MEPEATAVKMEPEARRTTTVKMEYESTQTAPPETETNVSATSIALPDGWETAASPVDGRIYYYNASTGGTSWTHPSFPGAIISVPAPSVPPPAPNNLIQHTASVGDESGIMANRSEIDLDLEASDGYTKMTEYNPKRPINSHRCYSIVALILFFPLGIFAFCKSLSTVSKWKQERYETAHDCSQQTLLFSRISCIIGIGFWSYFAYCFYAGPGPYVLIPVEWWPDVNYYFD